MSDKIKIIGIERQSQAIQVARQVFEYGQGMVDAYTAVIRFSDSSCEPTLDAVEVLQACEAAHTEHLTEQARMVAVSTRNAFNASNDFNAGERSETVGKRFGNASATLQQRSGNDFRPRYQGSLTNDVKNWLSNIKGCVTKKEIWDEFGLTHPQDKTNLRVILLDLVRENILTKDSYKKDTYWVREDECDHDDLDEAGAEDSGLKLPLGLHDYIVIPRGSVFLLEGCTNAGKTAFCFNVMRANFGAGIDLRYLYSEGSSAEVASRIKSFGTHLGDPFDTWKANIKTKFVPVNQHQYILQQNPAGLTIVDYIRAADGDFTKIGPAIDLIAESAASGFVMACVQKKTGNPYGVGGQNNHFAPRNVFSLDFVAKGNGIDLCYLTFKKCKYPRDIMNNPDGKEIHFAVKGGVKMKALSEPIFCNEQQRSSLFARYKQELGMVPEGCAF